jgi:hypothetical protein
MKRFKDLLIPGLLSVVFIFLTGYIAFSSIDLGSLKSFCFYFHLIPFGVGFAGGGAVIFFYYLILWIVLTLLFSGIKHFIKPNH